jgi:hypothetical protein
MAAHGPHKPHHRTQGEEAEDDPEPGMLPVEPDTGPVSPANPTDPAPDGAAPDPEA